MNITATGTGIDGTSFKLGDSKLRFKDDTANQGITDSDGIAEFIIDMPRNADRLKIKVKLYPYYLHHQDVFQEHY